MAPSRDEDDTSLPGVLARVCGELDVIRAVLAAAPDDARREGEAALDALREGRDTRTARRALHNSLRRAGIAGGLDGITRGVGGLPDTPGRPTGPVTLVCPVGRCTRGVLPDDPPDVPRECRLHSRQMRSMDPT
ncbi:hypothetical protein [Streptomyces sp. enrichment culture]|uniref:hypothetical protein n=1 Tax=Streptomyces sp. enrichment culture TaxID=1795815 RepID=UPI003F54913C